MKWCKRCVLPHTRPGLKIDVDGVCSACRMHEARASVDWDGRAAAFEHVVANARSSSSGYDCVIPVSGGKDSTWQVVVCLEHGLVPLAVTWKTPGRTEVGQGNLDNLVSLGVDHVDYQIDPAIEAAFMRVAFERSGDPAIPMHMALFSIPLKLAARFEIPLVVWGENSAFEYAGEGDEKTGFRLDDAWLKRYGVTHGTTADDWISADLPAKKMTAYQRPTSHELEMAGTVAVFLGYYFQWDPHYTYSVAAAHGFQSAPSAKTGYYSFADIDDEFISVHHYLKWHKFGFTRLFDNLSLEIRNSRMTRDQAFETIRSTGEARPDADIDRFCEFVGISRERFFEVADSFRTPEVWRRDGDRWVIDDFLIPDWDWS